MNKKRKYAYAAMTSACLVIAVIVVLNIVVATLSKKVNLNVDMTGARILDFDEKTYEITGNLDMDVDIISLVPEDGETDELKQIDEILKKYEVLSDHITYKRVDTKKNPAYLANYNYDGMPLNKTESPNYHIIFETERASEVVSIDSLIVLNTDYDRMQNKISDDKIIKPKFLHAEHYFTSSILKVVKGSDINVYVASGAKLSADDMKSVMPGTGYNFKPLSLTSEDIPADADVIAIVSPISDYSESEIDKVAVFLENGGDVQVFVDPDEDKFDEKYPNLSRFLGEWGIVVGDGYVYDGEKYQDGRSNIIATIPENGFTDTVMNNPGIDKTKIMFSLSRPVSAKDKNGAHAYTLATTSGDGYLKFSAKTSDDIYDKNAGDKKIQSDLAVISARENIGDEGTTQSRIFVCGTSNFIIMNTDLYSELTNFMIGTQSSTVLIMPKDIDKANVVIKQSTVYVYAFVVVAMIPVIILAIGFIIWIKRRHL